ncbi:hypothetical protein [Actinophytocola sp.]|uniref:hypothetical protein n=1 Tax=Actinophytocola sp. TaxID=1872138 RepID=UPI003D6BC2E0
MLTSSVWRSGARWWFSGGLLAGGLTSALCAVTLGSLLLRPILPGVAPAVLVAVAFALVASNELGLLRLRLPQNARQVPLSVVEEGARFGALQFGFEMGTGLRTFMTSGLPHTLAIALMLIAGLPEGLLAGLGFGAGRAWMTLSRHAHRDHDGWDAQLVTFDRTVRLGLTAAAGVTLGVLTIHSF